MECPKCKANITEDMLICPSCKKVLKLVCPKCNTINKSNTCKKCGFTIISKCHNCGKINQTINGKCSKCGFSTYTSVAINSSDIDEFACLTIEFSNLNNLKSILGSTKLIQKFKSNLDSLILDYTGSIGNTREIIENIYIIRFNKENSFKDSSKNAMLAAIEIQKLITNLNIKLNEAKNAMLECKIAVLKRDIYAKPEDYESGFDIKLIYTNKKELKVINALQIITDGSIYEQICDDFELNSLSSTFIKNQMMMFFELNLKKYIKISKATSKPEMKPAKPVIIEEIIHDEQEENEKNTKLISFDSLKCTFTTSNTLNLPTKVIDIFKNKENQLISIKCKNEYYPQSAQILNKIEETNLFNNIFRVTCYDEMKYKPYGFFNELITGIYNYSVSPMNFNSNNFDLFKKIDSSNFIKSLINLTERKFPHPEDVRFSLFDIFLNIFSKMKNSLIYIENFEKIDDTSLEILQIIFEKLNKNNVSYLIFTDKNNSLHKNAKFLLSQKNYTEIALKSTPVQNIIDKNPQKYDKILDSYYLKTIITNTKGSLLYFNNAINYLLENEFISFEKQAFDIEKIENILIPNELLDLIGKRLLFLSFQNQPAYKFLSLLLMIGPVIDIFTIKALQIPDEMQKIKILAEKNYIYVYNNLIYIQNFEILKNALLKNITEQEKKSLASELIQKVYSTAGKHPNETILFNILEQPKQEFLIWENLSKLNASMGDFSAYLICCIKVLKFLDNHVNEESKKTIDEYKMEVYENISNLLYKYTPNEIFNISKTILDNLEKSINDKKIIDLCNKMLQGCLISGNYSSALELINKILSKFSNASISPEQDNFNSSFFLILLVKTEVLFSIGALKDCEEEGEEILSVLTPENLTKFKPKSLSDKQFKKVIVDALIFTSISKVLLLKNETEISSFIEEIETKIGELPDAFKLIKALSSLIKGYNFEIPQISENNNDNKFTKILLNILLAFSTHKNDTQRFSNIIYQAKIAAQISKLKQIELFCDLLIGYSYFNLNQQEKASSIYYNVLEQSNNNGLKLITYIAWYLISMLKLNQHEVEIALGITNNALIQLEKDKNSGEYLILLFRLLLAEILTIKGDVQSAELCKQNAVFIKEKYELA